LQRDELLVEIETDKVVMEVVAPEDGVLATSIAVLQEGEPRLQARQLLATYGAGRRCCLTPAAEDSTAEAVPAIEAAELTSDVAALLWAPQLRQTISGRTSAGYRQWNRGHRQRTGESPRRTCWRT